MLVLVLILAVTATPPVRSQPEFKNSVEEVDVVVVSAQGTEEGGNEMDRLNLSPSASLIWGPGLLPHEIVLPARYFFIQLVDRDGQK